MKIKQPVAAVVLSSLLLGCATKGSDQKQDDARREEFSQDVNAFLKRGNERLDKGDLEGAVADYNEAIKLNPRSARAHNNRGLALYRKGDLEGALAGYDSALKIDPLMAEAYYNRGILRFRKNAYDEALADFGKATVLQPNYAAAYAGRGMVHAAKGDIRKAIEDYDKALQVAPAEWNQRKAVEGELRKLRDALGDKPA
jgi:tetratricopeptide (TPR) repeat protein